MIPNRWTAPGRCETAACVEVHWQTTAGAGQVLVRDGKNPAGPVLAFTPAEWVAFTAAVRAGQFDVPHPDPSRERQPPTCAPGSAPSDQPASEPVRELWDGVRVYPLTAPDRDLRLTYGLLLDVTRVLTDHGYPPVTAGADLVALQRALFGFLYRTEAPR